MLRTWYLNYCTISDPLPQGIIHPIVVQCVAYLNKESVLKEEGLFRIPGDVAVIKQLRERFINGTGSLNSHHYSISHVVTIMPNSYI